MTTNKTADTLESLSHAILRDIISHDAASSSYHNLTRFTTADTSCKRLTWLQQVETNRGGQLPEATTF